MNGFPGLLVSFASSAASSSADDAGNLAAVDRSCLVAAYVMLGLLMVPQLRVQQPPALLLVLVQVVPVWLLQAVMVLVVGGVDETAGAAGQVGVDTGAVGAAGDAECTAGAAGQIGVGVGVAAGAAGDAECTAVGQDGGVGGVVDAAAVVDEGRVVGADEGGGCCPASSQCACPASLRGYHLDPGCRQGSYGGIADRELLSSYTPSSPSSSRWNSGRRGTSMVTFESRPLARAIILTCFCTSSTCLTHLCISRLTYSSVGTRDQALLLLLL